MHAHTHTHTVDRCSARGCEGCQGEGGGVSGWGGKAGDRCPESSSNGGQGSVCRETSPLGACLQGVQECEGEECSVYM